MVTGPLRFVYLIFPMDIDGYKCTCIESDVIILWISVVMDPHFLRLPILVVLKQNPLTCCHCCFSLNVAV